MPISSLRFIPSSDVPDFFSLCICMLLLSFFGGGGWSSVLLTFQHVRRKHFCLYPLFKVECTWFISAVLISAFMQCGTTSRFPQKINVLVLVWFFNLLALCPKFNTRAQMRESP